MLLLRHPYIREIKDAHSEKGETELHESFLAAGIDHGWREWLSSNIETIGNGFRRQGHGFVCRFFGERVHLVNFFIGIDFHNGVPDAVGSFVKGIVFLFVQLSKGRKHGNTKVVLGSFLE